MDVSVVIPAYNVAGYIGECLTLVMAQEVAPLRFEIIVVDDGSMDDTAARAAAFEIDAPVPYRLVARSNGGPAAARNTGLAEAKGSVIAFLDADCLPTPGWLVALVTPMLEDATLSGVEGRTLPEREPGSMFDHTIENAAGGHCWTCNIAYRTARLREAGGFDERLRWCEDVDMARRMRTFGDIRFAPEALVYHRVIPWPFMKHLRLARTFPNLIRAWKKHPGLFTLTGTGFDALLAYQLRIIAKSLYHNRAWLRRRPLEYLRYTLLITLMLADTIWRAPRYWRIAQEPLRDDEKSPPPRPKTSVSAP